MSAASAALVFSQAQTPAPRRTFGVVSVKPNKSGPPTGTWTNPIAYPAGGFTATNVTLVDVIVQACGTRRIQMQGGPDWIDSERFDIVAKADASEGEVKRDQVVLMVQALLEDRFQLAVHKETKDLPVLALVGPRPQAFQESKEGQPTTIPGERGKLTFKHFPIGGLVNLTSNVLRTPVVDGTEIKGYYDFVIDPVQFAVTTPDGAPVAGTNYADIFETALREQLGFKLERRKAPLEVFVIDRASRPAEN